MLWNAVFGMGVCYPLWRMRGPRCAALRPTSWRLPALFDPRRTLGEAHCSARGAAGSPTWDTTQLLHLAAYPIIADLWFFCAHRAMHTHVAPPALGFVSISARAHAREKAAGRLPHGRAAPCSPLLYQRFHRMHHRFRSPEAICGTYCHPVEMMLVNAASMMVRGPPRPPPRGLRARLGAYSTRVRAFMLWSRGGIVSLLGAGAEADAGAGCSLGRCCWLRTHTRGCSGA